jgi:hypothetical protein
MTIAAASDPAGTIAGLAIWLLIFAAYWTPTIIASVRKVPNLGSVIVINFFAFVLFVPWIVALAMACRSVPKPAHAKVGAP